MTDEQTSQLQGVTIPPVEQGDPTRQPVVQIEADEAKTGPHYLGEALEDHVLEVVKACAELEQLMSCRALSWDELVGRDLFAKVRAVLRS